ncbi:four-carbon acid sugar kinase family protein [Acidiferrobacter sp.]|uniref:four-carbon acid sugar kinase family protein n=1 Tax=Acidiferrobacter sp. TaxID=1872107 RepID=UPI00345AAC0A
MNSVTAGAGHKVIVLDDDPTGSQTVHSCLLLTRWDTATLKAALSAPGPLFFILTNTRGMSAGEAAETVRVVCRNLRAALAALSCEGRAVRPIFVSRSDSTLRGHYPVETDVMAEELGPFDAHFLIPAFFEGGRVTRAGRHYLLIDGVPVPVHETEFARDTVFGFRNSDLREYVAEKTAGRIAAADVRTFFLSDVRAGCGARLRALSGNVCCVVDAVEQSDLDRFALDLYEAVDAGQRFLFRSAASLLTSLANLPAQPVPPEAMSGYARSPTGVVLVGSHVRKTTEQLTALLREPTVTAIEIDVDRARSADALALRDDVLAEVGAAHAACKTPVLFTSRSERQFADSAERLRFGAAISAFLMSIVQALPQTTGFLISKGGITSNDVLSTGLGLNTCEVVGQILPGCSVVCCPKGHPRYPDMPVVIFPGNVGDSEALRTVYRRMAGQS